MVQVQRRQVRHAPHARGQVLDRTRDLQLHPTGVLARRDVILRKKKQNKYLNKKYIFRHLMRVVYLRQKDILPTPFQHPGMTSTKTEQGTKETTVSGSQKIGARDTTNNKIPTAWTLAEKRVSRPIYFEIFFLTPLYQTTWFYSWSFSPSSPFSLFSLPFGLSLFLSSFPSTPERTKETKLERADFTLQLLMFVTAENERRMFIFFFFFQFLSAFVPAVISKGRLSASRP